MAQAYSMSKMTIVNEMEDFEKYNQMKKGEFYEFLARLSDALYRDSDLPLVKKLEKLLCLLLFVVLKKEIVIPDLDDDIESQSDCEDDHTEQILNECLPDL